QQPGIQLTQETFWSALPDALKQSLGFPELEEQFNLPTYSVHQGNVLGVKPLLGDIADKQAPIQQGQAALRGLLTMFGGGPAGLAPTSLRDGLGQPRIHQTHRQARQASEPQLDFTVVVLDLAQVRQQVQTLPWCAQAVQGRLTLQTRDKV